MEPEAVLDLLWLASGPWTLDLPRLARPAEQTGPARSEGKGDVARAPSAQQPSPAAEHPAELPDPAPAKGSQVFAEIAARAGEAGAAATPISLAAPRTLADPLPLARALRPLRQPFRSAQNRELDEEATAELTAELRTGGRQGVYPVERPRRERWFEVHLVREDDPAAALWNAPLAEFARLLGQSGSFRLIGDWQLRLDRENPCDLARATLIAPAGGEARVGQIGGDPRRLILFGSHGASPHWLDGSYPRLLKGWSGAALALLHLLRADRRAEGTLGEPHGVGWAPQAGAPAASFATSVPWWRSDVDPDSARALRLPMTALEPDAVGRWALAQMARGRTTPLYLLDSEASPAPPPTRSVSSTLHAEQRLARLRERSAHAYELAVALAAGPFTLPVARVVQETLFGSATDVTPLADLLLSGAVVPLAAPVPGAAVSPAFRVTDEARAQLMRSLRGEDRDRLVIHLAERVGANLARGQGGAGAFMSLVADPAGRARVPGWLVPFAEFTQGLLPPRSEPPAPGRDWRAWVAELDRRRLGFLHRLQLMGEPLDLTRLRQEIAGWITMCDMAVPIGERGWLLREALLDAVREAVGNAEGGPLFALSILWVDDFPGNNEQVVRELRQHGAQVVEVTSTEEAMADWRVLQSTDIIVSDMSRPPDREAGLDLIARLREQQITAPVVIFADFFARSGENRQRVKQAGGFGCTNDAEELLDLITDATVAWLTGWSPGDFADEGQLQPIMDPPPRIWLAREGGDPAKLGQAERLLLLATLATDREAMTGGGPADAGPPQAWNAAFDSVVTKLGWIKGQSEHSTTDARGEEDATAALRGRLRSAGFSADSTRTFLRRFAPWSAIDRSDASTAAPHLRLATLRDDGTMLVFTLVTIVRTRSLDRLRSTYLVPKGAFSREFEHSIGLEFTATTWTMASKLLASLMPNVEQRLGGVLHWAAVRTISSADPLH